LSQQAIVLFMKKHNVLVSVKVKENILKESGARGVSQSGSGVQVIYGPQVTVIKNEFEEIF